MLYDHKRWDKQVQVDPLTMESLIAWLEQRPADMAYDYDNCEGACLYGLYMAHHGIKWEESGASPAHKSAPGRERFCMVVYDNVARPLPWTFGAALERARKFA